MNRSLVAALFVVALTGAVRAETADSILANKKQQTTQAGLQIVKGVKLPDTANRLKNIEFNPCGKGWYKGGDGQCHPRLN
jgi:hypothetical protein